MMIQAKSYFVPQILTTFVYFEEWKLLCVLKEVAIFVYFEINDTSKFKNNHWIKNKAIMIVFQCQWLEYASQWVSKTGTSLLNSVGGEECRT